MRPGPLLGTEPFPKDMRTGPLLGRSPTCRTLDTTFGLGTRWAGHPVCCDNDWAGCNVGKDGAWACQGNGGGSCGT